MHLDDWDCIMKQAENRCFGNVTGQCNPFTLSPLRDFLGNTGYSAPVPRIGTPALVGPPFESLP